MWNNTFKTLRTSRETWIIVNSKDNLGKSKREKGPYKFSKLYN